MEKNRPELALPEPLTGLEQGSFAHYTLSERLPNIALQVIEDYEWSPMAKTNLEKLAAEMPDGELGELADNNAPDLSDWKKHIDPFDSPFL